MGMDAVKDEIIKDAQSQAKNVLKEAESEKAEILKQANDRIAEAKKRTQEALDSRLKKYRAAAEAEAESAINRQKLQLEKEILEETFATSRQKLASSPNRKDHVKKILKGVKKQFDYSKVFANKKDMKDAMQADILGGAILENKEGTVRVDYSYESLLEKVRQENLKEITKALFQ